MKTAGTPEFPLADLTITMMREVFQAISSTALEQAQAYAEIAGQVGVPLEDYLHGLLGFSDAEQRATAGAYVASVVLPLLSLPSSPIPDPVLFSDAGREALRDHFRGVVAVVGAPGAASLLDGVLAPSGAFWSIARADLEAFAAAKLRKEATSTYHRLNALLRAGMPSIVVTGGQICTKVTMRVSSAEEVKASSGALLPAGRAQAGLRVRVADERSVSLAKSAEMVGSIRIDFRTGTFPALAPPSPSEPAG